MASSLANKKEEIIKLFASCQLPEEKYEKIIYLGRKMAPLDKKFCTPERLVEGCQSLMYLKSEYQDGKMFFSAFSEALISAGLAALLIHYYNGEKPEEILATPADFITELGLNTTLTPGRSNGLASLYKKMRQVSLFYYLQEKQKNA